MKKHIVGYDIGGTKCKTVLADVSNGINILARIQFQTPATYSETLALLIDHTKTVLDRFSLSVSNLIAIGISCGGPLDRIKGIIHSPPNLPTFDGVHICDDVSSALGVPVFLQNDANACALVEWKLGNGADVNNMIFLTMGTGFGAGIIAEGVLINGANSMAGEIGHISLKDDGPEGFGKYGSIEGYCSGAGIAKQAIAYTNEKLASGITPSWIKDGIAVDDLTAKIIADYAYSGDSSAVEIFNEVGTNLGLALAILIDSFNPDRIIIGSIFTRCESLLRESMQRAIDSAALERSRKVCAVLPSKMGEELGELASILTACYVLGIDCSSFTPAKGAMFHYNRLFERYPILSPLKEKITDAFLLLARTYRAGGKVLVCGNGGSAADADHIVGELMKGFYKERKIEKGSLRYNELNAESRKKLDSFKEKLQGTLPAISLTQHAALSSAFSNDVDSVFVFAQQVYGLGDKRDALIALSTSGNSANVINAIKTADALGLKTVGLTGERGGEMMKLCDVCINAPGHITADIQELHLPIYHTLCAMLEEEFFGGAE